MGSISNGWKLLHPYPTAVAMAITVYAHNDPPPHTHIHTHYNWYPDTPISRVTFAKEPAASWFYTELNDYVTV